MLILIVKVRGAVSGREIVREGAVLSSVRGAVSAVSGRERVRERAVLSSVRGAVSGRERVKESGFKLGARCSDAE